MSDFLIVSEVARRLGIQPRLISDLFYKRALDDTLCPIVAGRRLIPADYVPSIKNALRERGLLTESLAAGAA